MQVRLSIPPCGALNVLDRHVMRQHYCHVGLWVPICCSNNLPLIKYLSRAGPLCVCSSGQSHKSELPTCNRLDLPEYVIDIQPGSRPVEKDGCLRGRVASVGASLLNQLQVLALQGCA